MKEKIINIAVSLTALLCGVIMLHVGIKLTISFAMFHKGITFENKVCLWVLAEGLLTINSSRLLLRRSQGLFEKMICLSCVLMSMVPLSPFWDYASFIKHPDQRIWWESIWLFTILASGGNIWIFQDSKNLNSS